MLNKRRRKTGTRARDCAHCSTKQPSSSLTRVSKPNSELSPLHLCHSRPVRRRASVRRTYSATSSHRAGCKISASYQDTTLIRQVSTATSPKRIQYAYHAPQYTVHYRHGLSRSCSRARMMLACMRSRLAYGRSKGRHAFFISSPDVRFGFD